MGIERTSDNLVSYLELRRMRGRVRTGDAHEWDTSEKLRDLLRQSLGREEALLREKNALALEHETLGKESDHRLMNGLQMVVSLLTLQSRSAPTPETAEQLSKAASRVAAIERIHQRLHHNDDAHTVAFKNYLESFSRDFSGIMNSGDGEKSAILVEGSEILIPASTAISLGFIVNELVTNAVKYGTGRVRIELETEPDGRHVVAVSNSGPPLPENFDPAASNGLGMKIVQAFTRKIGGKLAFARGDADQGARISILFS
jgi:two-component system, sensor histidine kinase PdtaS